MLDQTRVPMEVPTQAMTKVLMRVLTASPMEVRLPTWVHAFPRDESRSQ